MVYARIAQPRNPSSAVPAPAAVPGAARPRVPRVARIPHGRTPYRRPSAGRGPRGTRGAPPRRRRRGLRLAGLLALLVLVVAAVAGAAAPQAGAPPGARSGTEPVAASGPGGTETAAASASARTAGQAGPVAGAGETVAAGVPEAPGHAPTLAPTGRDEGPERLWLLGGLGVALAAAGVVAVAAVRGRREPRHDGRTDV
ncbi:hypothetical protein ABZ714_01420 [Streptomyces sp. NPDC006798]|uniref:hypothetical protein n=1 Tax=Streptomyces sp. NPDC006798 TaxID=3155462 RepID=UPI0033EDC1DB